MGDSAHTTHHTNPGEKSASPLCLEDENFSPKIGHVGTVGNSEFPTVPAWPIFEKSSHLREKGGVLMLLN
jgi:hypothetical protein